LGPHEGSVPWSNDGIVGVKRFLDKVWRYSQVFEAGEANKQIHKLIKKITVDIEQYKFNTAIAAFMEFLNENKQLSQENWESFLILLAPFAPHITDELWHQLKHKDSIHLAEWPKFDENLIKEETVTIVVQVLGRLRASLEMPAGSSQEEVKIKALADGNVEKHLEGKEIVKEIFVKDKLINFVVK
jgi:leucyl-tRNA synthetase